MPNNWEYYTVSNSSLADNGIHALIKDHNGRLWMGTYQSGLQSLKMAPTATVHANERFGFYPNPVSELLFIETDEFINAVKVFDLNGSICFVELSGNMLDVSKLPSGTYILELATETALKRAVFVKI